MKIYTLPLTTFNLNLKETNNDIINKELYEKIKSKKSEIDHVRSDWDSAKKLSNDYEYIYTSSNYKKNISSIIFWCFTGGDRPQLVYEYDRY